MRKKNNYSVKDPHKFMCNEKVFCIDYSPCETIKEACFTVDFKHKHHCNTHNKCFCSMTLEDILLLIVVALLICYCYNNTLTSTPYCEYYI